MEYYQFKQNNRTYTIDFCNDVVFKKIISDQESLPFLQFLVEAATGLKFQEFTLIPTVQPGNHVIDKQIRLDIHAKDESGQKILIEMQNTVMNATESKRFQYYNFIDIVNQLIRGQNYNDLQEVFTIVFIRDDSYFDELVKSYALRDKNGALLNNNLSNIIFISIPYATLKDSMSDIEIIAYILNNGINRDIMNIANSRQKRMIQHMENKYYEATGINYIDEAISAEIERNRLLSQLQESKKRGEETGLQQGLKKGLIQGKVKVFYN